MQNNFNYRESNSQHPHLTNKRQINYQSTTDDGDHFEQQHSKIANNFNGINKQFYDTETILSRNKNQYKNQYFKRFRKLYYQNRLFFFDEILSGKLFQECLQRMNLHFLVDCGSGILIRIAAAFLDFATSNCMPLCLRPFLAGFFFPLLALYFLNFKLICVKVTIHSKHRQYQEYTLIISYAISLFLMIIISFRGSGNLNNSEIKSITQQIIQKQQNKIKKISDKNLCQNCEIIKAYRSIHCTICNCCVPKFTKHSIFLNQCIGACNQLLYLFLMFSIVIAQGITLIIFFTPHQNQQDNYLLTKILFYLINNYLQWLAFVDFISILIYNLCYNCTQFQIRTWKYKKYFFSQKNQNNIKISIFTNPFDGGFCLNLKESYYALINKIDSQNQKNIQHIPLQSNQRIYIINWSRILIYKATQLPIYNQKHGSAIQLKIRKKDQMKDIVNSEKIVQTKSSPKSLQ